jgi:hypothetical protein
MHHTSRLFKRQIAEEVIVDQAEDRRVQPDPDCEGGRAMKLKPGDFSSMRNA